MPAAPGLAMLVPLIEMVVQLLVVTLVSLRAEMMPEPGIVRSGLMRLSVGGPQVEKLAIELAEVPRSVAPTEMPFLLVDGLPTVPVPGPELPAANRISMSVCVNMKSSTSCDAAVQLFWRAAFSLSPH